MGKIRLLFIVFAGVAVAASSMAASVSIRNTKHNLSSSGKYNIKASSESQICKFCHTPHNSESTQAPLWNHIETTATFTLVTTAHVVGGRHAYADTQPSGISKKCLSCHDGTVAIGATLTGGDILMTGSNVDFSADSGGRTTGKMSSGAPGYLGYNLQAAAHFKHPISFIYDEAAKAINADPFWTRTYRSSLTDPPFSPYNKANMLDRNGKVQCHTCHNPHTDMGTSILGSRAADSDPLWRKKLDCVGDNASVCGACHDDVGRDSNGCPTTDYDY